MPRILSVATAVPRRRYRQEEIKEACRPVFGDILSKAGRPGIFDRAGVKTRHFARELEYYLAGPSFGARNQEFLKQALPLSAKCLRDCLKEGRKSWRDVGHIITVTTTGLLTPSLESHLAHALPLPRTVKRTPIFGVGCAGGAVGLARAAEYLEARPSETVLLLSAELCSFSFRRSERTMSQLIGAALFGDGVAAALLCGDRAGGGVEVLGSQSLLLPDSLDVMGWDFDELGMRLVLSPRAPAIIQEHLRPAAESFLALKGFRLKDVKTFLFHPGSAKILDGCQEALGLAARDLRYSRRFLARYGNLSSASLLFILRDAMKKEKPPSGSLGLLGAFGPGFSCELMLLRFP